MTQAGNIRWVRGTFLWALLNLAILGIGSLGLPLCSHHPFPRTSVIFFELLCGQAAFACLLFPVLADSIKVLAVNLVLILPIDELAGLLNNLSQMQILRGYACIALWLCGLGGWRWAVRADRSHLIVIGVCSCFCMGGAVFDYLRSEAAVAKAQPEAFYAMSLLPNLCRQASQPNLFGWVEAAVPAVTAMLWSSVVKLTQRRAISLHPAG